MVKRKRTTKTSEAGGARFTEDQFVSFVLSRPELRESLGFGDGSLADVILDAEDVGWIGSRTCLNHLDMLPTHRKHVVNLCRQFYQRDPLAKQAVRLWTDYAVGTGITYKATGADGKTADTATQKQLDRFWKYHRNRNFTSSRGQQELSKKLLMDGELFFAIFTGGDVPVIRTIDCLQIEDIICDPEDEQEVLCYKRIDRSSPPKTTYYKDWAADPDMLAKARDPDDKRRKIVTEDNVVIYHLPFDKLGKRGNSLLSCVVGWSNAHKTFMEKRVSIIASLARFAWNANIKGGQAAIEDFKKDFNSSLSGSSRTRERNPNNASGGIIAHNQGVDLTPMPRATGAGDAKSDGDQLKLMFFAGVNFPQHYFGDASNANLATATAMELPVLKVLTGYQEFWKDGWRDLMTIVLGEDIDSEPATIQIALPAMLQDDLGKLGIFLEGLHGVFPEIAVPEILQLCLVAIGVPDVAEAMKSIEARKAELSAASQNQPTPPVTGKQPPQLQGKGAVSEAAKVRAMNKLSKVLTEVFAAA
jgi:hypothetical protein